MAVEITGLVKFPRGKIKEKLARNNLIAKVNTNTAWDENDIKQEMHDFFQGCFETADKRKFEFTFLSTVEGTKVLREPKVNRTYVFDASAVLALNRTTIHILSNLKHKVSLFLFFIFF